MSGDPPRGPARFATTRWSLVVATADADPETRRAALEDLCAGCWLPLYAFARRGGAAPAEAQDRVQGFLADLLARDDLRRADPRRGRFRTFLLAAFRHFLSKERERDRALKRGGGRTPLSLDFDDGERRYSLEPSHDRSPEREYERRWALALLDRILAGLRAAEIAAGRGDAFDALAPLLGGGDPGDGGAAAAAERLGLAPGAVRVALHRLRRRYRAALRAAIAETVADPAEVDDEIHHLLGAVGG